MMISAMYACTETIYVVGMKVICSIKVPSVNSSVGGDIRAGLPG